MNPPISRHNEWLRRLCPIPGTRLVLSGDLPENEHDARRHLDGWVDAGITHIIDVRMEYSDEEFVRAMAPDLTYVHLGVDDAGQPMEDGWFEAGVGAALEAFADPAATVLVHCHMGINRGPSMGFAIMLALGFIPQRAFEAIIAARPIAAVLYADDAIDWWHRRNGFDGPRPSLDYRGLFPVDEFGQPNRTWAIHRIRSTGAA